MGLGIVEFFLSLEERFDMVFMTGDKDTPAILTVRDLIDHIVRSLHQREEANRNEDEWDVEIFELLRAKYAEMMGTAIENVSREYSCYRGFSTRKRAQFARYLNEKYPEINRLTEQTNRRCGCIVFILEILAVASLAVMAFTNLIWFLIFMCVFAFVLYDVITPGPFMARSLTAPLKRYQTLGNLARWIASKQTVRRDENGNPWTNETVTAVVLEVLETEFDLRHDQIDLDMRLSEID